MSVTNSLYPCGVSSWLILLEGKGDHLAAYDQGRVYAIIGQEINIVRIA
ncbi:MAG: hypothetical protein ACTS7E_01800 [Arsenophonus sp. NC-CH8-MAG3]